MEIYGTYKLKETQIFEKKIKNKLNFWVGSLRERIRRADDTDVRL